MSKISKSVWAVRGVDETTKDLFHEAAKATGKKVGELANEVLREAAERILIKTLSSKEDFEKYKETIQKIRSGALQHS